jgi:periplasmic copper chaperone A
MIVLLLLLVLAAPASAHVTVIPDVARPGDTVALTFRVPNERDDAATVGLDLFLPPGVPAKFAPHPGWSRQDLGDGHIVWTVQAPDKVIGPGRTQDFKVTLGPLPQQNRITFKALQHYADGQIVRWIQTSSPDDERPAAFLDLSGKGAGKKDKGAWPLYVGAVAVIVAVVTLALFRRRRRT